MINIYRLGGVTLSSRQLYAHVLNLLVKALTETNKDFYNKKGKCLNLDDIGGCKVSFASCDQKPHHITLEVVKGAYIGRVDIDKNVFNEVCRALKIRHELALKQILPVLTHSGKVNLCGVNLSHRNLKGMNLRDVDLSGATLVNTVLSGADLTRALFSHAKLSFGDFSGAHAIGTIFLNCDASNAIFTNTHLPHAVFSHSDLSHADFSGADLTGVRLENNMISKEFFIRLGKVPGAQMKNIIYLD